MALAIAALAAGLIVRAGGGGAAAWALAAPVAFFGLQGLALPIVLLGELLERAGAIPKGWRAQLHEGGVVCTLLALTWCLVGPPLAFGVLGFFTLMYALRILFRANWRPGPPEESKR